MDMLARLLAPPSLRLLGYEADQSLNPAPDDAVLMAA